MLWLYFKNSLLNCASSGIEHNVLKIFRSLNLYVYMVGLGYF